MGIGELLIALGLGNISLHGDWGTSHCIGIGEHLIARGTSHCIGIGEHLIAMGLGNISLFGEYLIAFGLGNISLHWETSHCIDLVFPN